MELSSLSLTTYQTCLRRYILEQRWRPMRVRAKTLFDRCLRAGILALSEGKSPSSIRDWARGEFMARAADPGLDTPRRDSDPYSLAADLCGVLDTVLTAISRTELLLPRRIPPQVLPQATIPDLTWRNFSYADDTGTLHRWLSTDSYDQDFLYRQMHSWNTVGDMAVCDAAMQLHVVVIGQHRSNHQQSPWCRAYKHPAIAGQFRFQKPDGKGGYISLTGDWQPLWYASQQKKDPDVWVEVMTRDGLMPRLLHHPSISPLTAGVRQEVLSQIGKVAAEIHRTEESLRRTRADRMAEDARLPMEMIPEPAMELPMSRGACDGMVPCRYQMACFRETPALDIASLGAYSRKAPTDSDGDRQGSIDVPLHRVGTVESRA